MTRFGESGAQVAATGACLFNLGACLGPACINLARIGHCLDQRGRGFGKSGFKMFPSGLRLRNGGLKFLSFGIN